MPPEIPPIPISHPPVRILRYVLPLILLGAIVYLVLSRLATIEEMLLVIQKTPVWPVVLALLP